MKKTVKFALAAVVLTLGLSACTDATFEKTTAYNNPRIVKCWSGDTLIYEGRSTGRIESEANSDGYYFVDANTGKLTEVSGNCILVATKR